ncbi:MAG: RNA-binding protein [Firmicutes bacterium]|nr:RNA-binding protein [Bacillota bacterium]
MDDKDTKLVIAIVEEEANRVCKDHKVRCTSFYNPAIAKAVERNLFKLGDIGFTRYGGYTEAERTIFVLYPSYMDSPQDSSIQVIRVKWNPQYYNVDHRDILGSFIGFGIKREKIGDIIIDDGNAFVFIICGLASYITNNLERIGRAPVSLDIISCEEVTVPEPRIKTINTTVASPRLDSIVSACFGLSRTKTLPYIDNGSVSVNWEVIQKPDHILDTGDILSIRGLGRGKVKDFGQTSKKDRLFIVLEKYI